MLGNVMHPLRDFGNYSCKETIERKFHIGTSIRMSGLCFTYAFCGSGECFKDSSKHSFKYFFHVTTTLSSGHLNGCGRRF